MQATELNSLEAYAASRIELERLTWAVAERRRLLNESSAESCPSTLVRLPPMCSGAVPEADVRRCTSLGVCIMLPGRIVGATGRSSSCERKEKSMPVGVGYGRSWIDQRRPGPWV